MKRTPKTIADYVEKSMAGHNNISISTGKLTEKEIETLAKRGIKAVDNGFWGYWKFTRDSTPDNGGEGRGNNG